jgi:hypothetical protein
MDINNKVAVVKEETLTVNNQEQQQQQQQQSVNQFNSIQSTSLLSIKVRLVDLNIIKTLQFNPNTLVFDALKIIREKIPETNTTNGLFFFTYL